MASSIENLEEHKEEFLLKVHIHYLRAKFDEDCSVLIEIARGKNEIINTETISCKGHSTEVEFNHSENFKVIMNKVDKKYKRKYLSLQVFEIRDNQKNSNGIVTIDYTLIPALKELISRREVIIQNDTDSNTAICISLALEPYHPKLVADSLTARNMAHDTKAKTGELSEKKDDSEKDLTFNDLIVNISEIESESESSSSEEEYKELPPDRLVAHSMPKTAKEYVTPNQHSNALQIARAEERAGISTKREGTNCANCTIS